MDYDNPASLPDRQFHPILGPSTDANLIALVRLNFELEGLFDAYCVNFPEISIYIGGGEADSFESLVKDHIFVVPNLVLIELNCILNHHVA